MPRHRILRFQRAFVAAIVLALAAAGTLALTAQLDAAPQVLDAVGDPPPRGTAAHYRAAHSDRAAFTAVRCYCGCEASLGHRNLRDCFLTAEDTWEPHADGCGVCIAEAIDVVALRADGVPLQDIIRNIDERFSAILAES